MPQVYLASVSLGNFIKSYLVNGSINFTLHKNLSVQVLPKIVEGGTVMDKMVKCVFLLTRTDVVLRSLC